MSDHAPRSLTKRLFVGALLALGAVIALKLAFDLLATFWGWLVLTIVAAAVVWVGVVLFRHWREQRW